MMTKLAVILILALCFFANSNGIEENLLPALGDAECVAFLHEGKTNVLKTNDILGPIVFGYDKYNVVQYRYPDVNTECIYRDGDPWLHLSCAGNPMILTRGPIHDRRNYTTTYLYHKRSNPRQRGLGIHGEDQGLTLFQSDAVFKCTAETEPIFINAPKRKGEKEHGYQTGYYVTPLDFLKVLEFKVASNGNLIVKATLTPAASLMNENQESKRFGHGLLHHFTPAKSLLDYRFAYQLDNQLEVFKDQWPELNDLREYINDTQHLIMTQLISEEDFFYLNEKAATYFYENTVPVWKSIAFGNWQRIGQIMRNVAAQTDSEFDLYATTYGHYKGLEDQPVVLAPENGHEGPIAVPVPWVLQRYMIDKKNPRRGISYHVINNPFMDHDEIRSWLRRRPKCRMVECHIHQPEFLDPQQGFTFCCAIDDETVIRH